MTLTRPAYRATITNHTRGWTRTVTAGDTPDPELPVQLLDGLELGWQSQDSRPFTQLDPSTATFTIAARTVDDLLPIDYDDEVSVDLVRPMPTGPARPIAYLGGPVSDLNLSTSVRSMNRGDVTAVTHSVTIIDPLSTLDTPITIDEVTATDGKIVDGPFHLEGATMKALSLAQLPAAYTNPPGSLDKAEHKLLADNEPVRDLLARIHFGVRDKTRRAIAILRSAHHWNGPSAGYEFVGEGPYRYFVDYWDIDAATPLHLFTTLRDDRVVTVQRVNVNDEQGAVHVLPARLVDGATTWIKNRRRGGDTEVTMIAPADVTNGGPVSRTSATGPSSPTSPRETVELTTAIDPLTITSGDPVNIGIGHLEHALNLQVDARRPTRAYGLPGALLRTIYMTDAEWDHHCLRLWPAALPSDSVFGRPIVLADVAPEVNPAGHTSAYVQWGAKLTLERGEVVAQLQLVPRPLATAATAALTLAQISASGTLAATRLRESGAVDPYLDPRLTYDDLKLTTL